MTHNYDVWHRPDEHRRALNNLRRRGYAPTWELAPAKAFIDGRGTGLSGQAWVAVKRTDGGYPKTAR